MSSGSNFETYSEDYSDGAELPAKSKNSPKPSTSSLKPYSSERRKATDCSCQTDFRHKNSYTSHSEVSRIPKHRRNLSKREDRKLCNLDYSVIDEVSSLSDVALSPKNRPRKLSEQPRKNRLETVRQRARTLGPSVKNKPKAGAKTTAQNIPTQTHSTATRKLLSARKLKIDDLRNEILDLQRQLTEEQKENKILRNLYNRQQKELDKVEESRVEIPELEKAHDEEIRVLKTLMRKVQDKNKELETKLKTKEDELQRRFNSITSLKTSLQQKKKTEGEMDKRMTALKMRVQKRDETISMLKENLSTTEKKLSDDRKSHENAKSELKSLRKKYDELRRNSGELQMLKHSAIQACSSSEVGDRKHIKSPGKSDIFSLSPHQKQQDTFSCREKDDQRLRRTVGDFTEKDKPSIKPLVAATRVLLASSSSEARPDSSDSRNVAKSSSEARPGTRLKASHSENMHVPLIFPTSAPIKSITESDSSCAGSQADEFGSGSRKTPFKGNRSFIAIAQLSRDVSKQR